MPSLLPGKLLKTLLFGAFLLTGTGAVHADNDHEQARQALASGEILPLTSVLQRIEQSHPGQVIDVELEREERWIYKVKILQRGGLLLRLKVDARDGSILDSRTRDRSEKPRTREHDREPAYKKERERE